MITLKTLPNATAQEVFDQVTTHLLQQNSRSIGEKATCMYRGDENKVCAAGCLIADDEYIEGFEYQRWQELYNDGWVPENHMELINELQLVHDSIPTDIWETTLRKLAKDRNLNFNN